MVAVVSATAVGGTPGVRSWPAIQGSAVAKACDAKVQSCLPGAATTAQVIPLALPSAHSEFAAERLLAGSLRC